MPHLLAPDSATIYHFLAQQAAVDFSYPGVGLTRSQAVPAGFDQDINSVALGQGEDVWAAAKAAIRQWLARLAYPVTRTYQRKFGRDSRASMLRFVQQAVPLDQISKL